MTKKIVGLVVIASLVIPSCIYFEYNNINHYVTNELLGIHNSSDISSNYSNFIELDQEKLQLHHEVTQFEIKFHHNDSVAVALFMYVSYVDKTITSNYFLLTDGNQPLMKPRSLFFIPNRKFEFVTPRVRISIGKYWLLKFLNERQGRIRIGSSCNDSHQFEVHSGDTWFLTFAVPTSSELSGYNVTIRSRNDSMEINQLTRHSNLGLYVANFNQFSGKYYAIKFGIFGGLSICNINKKITTKTGSIIDFDIAAHRKGLATVTLPGGVKKSNGDSGYIRYVYLGNQTGDWTFAFKGWSLYYLIAAILIYIDIDPHGLLTTNSS
jgi:hypothetical protein